MQSDGLQLEFPSLQVEFLRAASLQAEFLPWAASLQAEFLPWAASLQADMGGRYGKIPTGQQTAH